MEGRKGRYLFVSSLLRYGGGEGWRPDPAEGLAARGHDVVVASRPGSALSYKAPLMGIPWMSVRMRSDYDMVAVLRLARVLRHFRPDVVCPNLDREIRLCAMAIRLASLFGFERPRLIPRRGSEFPLKDNARYRYVYTRDVERVIVNSNATRRTMLSKTPWFTADRTTVIYNGIDVAPYNDLLARREELRASLRSEIGVADTAPIVVLVGELNERKGHRFIVRAAPVIRERCPDAHFLFVGDGDARAEIERSIAEQKLEDGFTLLGFREDVAEILVGCDVLVLPSRVEGFGYVLVEAMAAGLPVVASKVSSIPEVVDEGVTGYLHPVGDVDVLAEHVGALLGTQERGRRMGHRGRAAVANRFNINRMIDEVEALFARR